MRRRPGDLPPLGTAPRGGQGGDSGHGGSGGNGVSLTEPALCLLLICFHSLGGSQSRGHAEINPGVHPLESSLVMKHDRPRLERTGSRGVENRLPHGRLLLPSPALHHPRAAIAFKRRGSSWSAAEGKLPQMPILLLQARIMEQLSWGIAAQPLNGVE